MTMFCVPGTMLGWIRAGSRLPPASRRLGDLQLETARLALLAARFRVADRLADEIVAVLPSTAKTFGASNLDFVSRWSRRSVAGPA